MTDSQFRFVQRMKSPWSGYLPLWAFAIVIWCANSVLLLGFAQSPRNFTAALVANLFSAVFMLLIGLVWSLFLRRKHPHWDVPLWTVFAIGALVGLVKGLTTYAIVWEVSKTDYGLAELLQNAIPAVLTGLWLIPAFAIVGSLKEEYSEERERLINSVVRFELSSATEKYIDEDINEFVMRAKMQLDHAENSSESFQEILLDLAERDVRPLSHKLWKQQDARIRTFHFRDLALSTMTIHRFPAFWASFSLFISLLMLQVPLVGFPNAVLRSLLQAGIAFVFLLIGRVIPWRGKISGPLTFFAIPAVIVSVIELSTTVLFGPLPGMTTWIADSSLFLGLITTLLILGSAFSARTQHDELLHEMAALNSGDIAQDAEHVISLIRRRETAEILHGYVQNQLLTNALKLQGEPEAFGVVKKNISHVLSNLEDGKAGTSEFVPLSMHDLAGEVTSTWRGIMNVTFTHDEQHSMTREELNIIYRLVSECASNARRHGNAEELSIQISCTSTSIDIHAIDNGISSSQGPAGLGTALFRSLSAGNWSLRINPEGQGTILSCSIPRIAAPTLSPPSPLSKSKALS